MHKMLKIAYFKVFPNDHSQQSIEVSFESTRIAWFDYRCVYVEISVAILDIRLEKAEAVSNDLKIEGIE